MTYRDGGIIEGEPTKYAIRHFQDGRCVGPALAEYDTLEEAIAHPARPDMVLAVYRRGTDPVVLKPNHLRHRP